jgi:hypothetical protein
VRFEDLIKQLLEEIEAKKIVVDAFLVNHQSSMVERYEKTYQHILEVCAQLEQTTDFNTRLQLGAQLVLNYMPEFRGIHTLAFDEFLLEREAGKYKGYAFESRRACLKQWLLLEDVDKNTQLEIYPGDGRWTILKEICTGSRDLIPYALKQGCHPNIQGEDFFRNTPLTWAIAHDAKNAVNELVDRCCKRGISLDLDMASGFNQNTPLILAIAKGHNREGEQSNYTLTKFLLEQGADPNKADENGFTPLHYAYLRRDLETIKLLTQHGADHDAKNHAEQTPWDMLLWTYDGCRDKLFEITNGHDHNSCTFSESDVFKENQEICGKFAPATVARYASPPNEYPLKFVTPYSMFTPRFKLQTSTLQKQQEQYVEEVVRDCDTKDLNQVVRDWNRPSTIQIAGEQLKRENGEEMWNDYFIDADDLKDFFDEHLIQPLGGLTCAQQEALLAVCQSSLHQGGVMYPARRVFLSDKTTQKGYHVELKPKVNITPVASESALYFHEVEECRGWFIDSLNAKKDYFKLETVLKLTIGDDLQPKLEVVDFRVTTHNSIALPCFDERTLLEKLIDFLKSLFGMQAIHVNPDVLQHESKGCQM